MGPHSTHNCHQQHIALLALLISSTTRMAAVQVQAISASLSLTRMAIARLLSCKEMRTL